MTERTAERLAQLVAIVLAQSCRRCSLVELLGVEDKADVFELGSVGEFIHFTQRQPDVVGSL